MLRELAARSPTYVLDPPAAPAAMPEGDATGALIARLEAASKMIVVATTPRAAAARLRALELAREITGRSLVVACRGAVPEPGCRLVTHGDTLQTERVLRGERPAGFIIEVVSASHNACVPPPHFFQRVREACDAAGALLIADETTLGFARTGALFAIEREKTAADLMAVSLEVAPGTLGGVVLARASLGLAPRPAAVPAAAAALATLEVIERDKLVNHVKQAGKVLQARLHEILETRRQWAMDTRGRGLLRSLSLWDDPAIVIAAAEERGLRLARTGTTGLLFAPPIDTPIAALEAGLAALDEVFAAITKR